MIKKNKKLKIDTDTILIIEWNDAQADADWDEIKKPDLAKCITVGFLIAEDDKAICIGSTYSKPFSNARIHIPKAWILSRKSIFLKSDQGYTK